MTIYGKECGEGQDLEKFFLQCGVKTEYLNGRQTAQQFRFNFSGGWYTDSQLERAMQLLKNKGGYGYELNRNGGFTVTRPRKIGNL